MAFGRHGRDNAAVGFAMARADVPGGREADAERLAAVIEALTGEEPKVLHIKNGRIMRIYHREHLGSRPFRRARRRHREVARRDGPPIDRSVF